MCSPGDPIPIVYPVDRAPELSVIIPVYARHGRFLELFVNLSGQHYASLAAAKAARPKLVGPSVSTDATSTP